MRQHAKVASKGKLFTANRTFHSSRTVFALKSLQRSVNDNKRQNHAQIPSSRIEGPSSPILTRVAEKKAKKNQVGVQLLSRDLHAQIFRNVHLPPPQATYVRIAREHLRSHGLDPHQSSTIPDTSFLLPSLQGATIDEHFYRIGMSAAQPWLGIAQNFADCEAPPKPEHWHVQPGWTRYHYSADGSSYSESVSAPGEEMLSFDVETLPKYSQYAVIACAMSDKYWYSWISPWLLGETDEPEQLIPLGDPDQHRVVIGHNVSYDRARVREEYNIMGNQTRFIDTMALHVAVKGISSHQRPAWMKYRKSKKEEKERKEEALEAALELIRETEERHDAETDADKRVDLLLLRQSLEDGIPQMQNDDETEAVSAAKRWEDITSANSLADVAKLHCDIQVDKDTRNDFLTHTPSQILDNITDYLNYCAGDVQVTHAVFSKAFPAFLAACPSPVSLAGILTMGSSFLTVDKGWTDYLQRAEKKYRELEEKIKKRLICLAEEARDKISDGSWMNDTWLAQLDWSPKVAGASRGIAVPPRKTSKSKRVSLMIPIWLHDLRTHGPFHSRIKKQILPLLFRCKYDGHRILYSSADGWLIDNGDGNATRIGSGRTKLGSIFGKKFALKAFREGLMTSDHSSLVLRLIEGEESLQLSEEIIRLAEDAFVSKDVLSDDPWLSQLNWDLATMKDSPSAESDATSPDSPTNEALTYTPVIWPKWYWDLARPKKEMPPGSLDITVRNRLAPLLLRLRWQNWPLFHSREHGWIFRVDPGVEFETRLKALNFYDAADASLQESVLEGGYKYYKMPHKDGESANVGSPLGKTFMKYALDGTLTSPGNEATDALDMNAQCSYWISSRDRIMNQMVVWERRQGHSLGFHDGTASDQKWGIILPQVVSMGTVTRRAIEKTWLTASNAKSNRVGSELKAMVRAPNGYVIIGADVDSEELWISSVMGDAQFGFHGATALGWMTLEGTKSSGTDLHSKTANILGISRDQAKVFNYSRIYGAGVRHAILLLLQSNPNMLQDNAKKQAEKLYASTKGRNTHRTDMFGRKFWFGGTESFVFNKLEEIALSDRPQTPALGCGVTYALSKEYLKPGFGTDYMTSRINWVVQSSGVDYLHLLIVSMQHLVEKYDIKARYLISVHDELRYLVQEKDKYRAALALQIANLWTRCLFAYRLGMDDLPQSVAFFSAVDIDKVLRKEVTLPCVTPSQPDPIAPGEALDITGILEKTNGGSLWADGRPMSRYEGTSLVGSLDGYVPPNCMTHRATSARFLQAQATTDFEEIRKMAEMEQGETFVGGIGGYRKGQRGYRAQYSENEPKNYAAISQAPDSMQAT